ncbi:MAG TPA: hypothetical protein DHV85_20555 [Candidatus Accumulibacter sp.]|nr:hypothetical protein [Accumulibacter sp.]
MSASGVNAKPVGAGVPVSVMPRLPWPAALPEQVAAVASVLAAAPAPLAEAALATRVIGKRAWKKHLSQIVATLEALGRVRRQGTLLLSAGQPRRTNRHPRRRG